MDNFMSATEVLFHISMGNSCGAMGSMHVMSPTQFKRLEKSIDHHLATGDLVHGEYGLMLKQDVK